MVVLNLMVELIELIQNDVSCSPFLHDSNSIYKCRDFFSPILKMFTWH